VYQGRAFRLLSTVLAIPSPRLLAAARFVGRGLLVDAGFGHLSSLPVIVACWGRLRCLAARVLNAGSWRCRDCRSLYLRRCMEFVLAHVFLTCPGNAIAVGRRGKRAR